MSDASDRADDDQATGDGGGGVRGSAIERFLPPIAHRDLPRIGGSIGPDPGDFVVDEIPSYTPAGEGSHWLARLRKTARTTADLVGAVADAAGVRDRDIGVAGMKDKWAVTTQWLSVPSHDARPPEAWVLPQGFELLEAGAHGNKLRRGHLRGNRFSIRIVDAERPDALRPLIERIREAGLANYFGSQRFGVGGNNLADAIEWLGSGGLARLGRRERMLRKLFPSVLQSEIFNRYVRVRSEEVPAALMAGEVVRLDGSTRTFRVEDAAAEEPRRIRRDVHPTGPLPGPKMTPAQGRPLEIEREVIASLGLEPEVFVALGKHAPGGRRDIYIYPGDLEASLAADGSILVEFTMPAGSYATEVIRTLTGNDERTRTPR